ncbi:hypothetical protein [Colwellia sp. 12G3]|uniref:hypothetical protein n=1 Tax=Colwellia sp. 12G3 TaxID=2058299 RepID=UPI000C324A06|nr:hypothetical protein [Colwellia sp. 12G3]PKI16286.1 hypothetical protein CXF71_10080 [Colwellia sp. 12G3]
MKFLCYFLVLMFSFNLQALDKKSYKPTMLPDLLIKSAAIAEGKTLGQSIILPPERLFLTANILELPKRCNAHSYVQMIMNMSQIKIPPINYCMKVATDSGVSLNLFVQDTLSKSIVSHYKVNQSVNLYSLWIMVNASDKLPYFIINAIEK